MSSSDRRIDEIATFIARRQHGVVTRAQLLGAGAAPGTIDDRVRRGRLEALHRGVYLVGPLPLPRTREMAAVLAAGPSAVVSHGDAAILLALRRPQRRLPVHVTVVGTTRRRPGLVIHRVGRLEADEVTRLDGIPLTTAARTLLDLSGSVRPRVLRRCLEEAIALGRTTAEEVRAILDRHPQRAGSRALRALLAEGDPPLLLSEAESLFQEHVRAAGLPRPETNTLVAGWRVDSVWHASRVVAEIDGFPFHRSRERFELDRRRDADLQVAGYRVLRVTWQRLVHQPRSVIAQLASLLERGRIERAALP